MELGWRGEMSESCWFCFGAAEAVTATGLAQAADKAVFEIGGSVAPGAKLELRSGGAALPPPRTREERLDAIIFRVDDHDAIRTLHRQRPVARNVDLGERGRGKREQCDEREAGSLR